MAGTDGASCNYYQVDAVSASFLKDCATQSLAHARARQLRPRTATPAMQLGTVTHAAILEPERAGQLVLVSPDDFDGRTREGKALKQEAADKGLIWFTSGDWLRVQRMRDSVMSDTTARAYLEAAGKCEHEVYWDEDNPSGQGTLKAKAKLDKVIEGGPVIDLKTAQDASENGFGRACFSAFRYDIQAEWYLRASTHIRGCVRSEFVFIVVESEEPHITQCYRLDEAALENAGEEIQCILMRVVKAKETGIWPAYGGGLKNLYLPAWMSGGVA